MVPAYFRPVYLGPNMEPSVTCRRPMSASRQFLRSLSVVLLGCVMGECWRDAGGVVVCDVRDVGVDGDVVDVGVDGDVIDVEVDGDVRDVGVDGDVRLGGVVDCTVTSGAFCCAGVDQSSDGLSPNIGNAGGGGIRSVGSSGSRRHEPKQLEKLIATF